MPALITNIIPKQGFEIVRDAIGAILVLELTNQKTLQGSTLFPWPVNVFKERLTVMDNEENIYINILVDSATYSNKSQKEVEGRTTYFVDVYTRGKGNTDGTSESTVTRDKFIGMIRYILSSTMYNTLGMVPGLIGGTMIDSFATLDPASKEDSEYTSFARLTYTVRIQEGQAMWQGIDLVGNDTEVKLEETEKGYQYVFEG
jgi:hypothetical protein